MFTSGSVRSADDTTGWKHDSAISGHPIAYQPINHQQSNVEQHMATIQSPYTTPTLVASTITSYQSVDQPVRLAPAPASFIKPTITSNSVTNGLHTHQPVNHSISTPIRPIINGTHPISNPVTFNNVNHANPSSHRTLPVSDRVTSTVTTPQISSLKPVDYHSQPTSHVAPHHHVPHVPNQFIRSPAAVSITSASTHATPLHQTGLNNVINPASNNHTEMLKPLAISSPAVNHHVNHSSSSAASHSVRSVQVNTPPSHVPNQPIAQTKLRVSAERRAELVSKARLLWNNKVTAHQHEIERITSLNQLINSSSNQSTNQSVNQSISSELSAVAASDESAHASLVRVHVELSARLFEAEENSHTLESLINQLQSYMSDNNNQSSKQSTTPVLRPQFLQYENDLLRRELVLCRSRISMMQSECGALTSMIALKTKRITEAREEGVTLVNELQRALLESSKQMARMQADLTQEKTQLTESLRQIIDEVTAENQKLKEQLVT